MRDWHRILTSTSMAPAWSLTEKGAKYIERVISSPPSRRPSNATRRNVLVDFASRKMGHTIELESATVEAAFALVLEMDERCTGYWAQPERLPVPRRRRDGTTRNQWVTFDFLVLYSDKVVLCETKPEEKLFELSQEHPELYQRAPQKGWQSPETTTALEEYGIEFRVVSSSDLPPTLMRNLSILSQVAEKNYSRAAAAQAVLNAVPDTGEGASLHELISGAGTGYTKDDIYVALFRNDLHAALEHSLLADIKISRVFRSRTHLEAYRLLHICPQPAVAPACTLRAGHIVIWGGSEFRVCHVSPDSVFLQSGSRDPVPLSHGTLNRFITEGHIVVHDQEACSLAQQVENIDTELNVRSPESQELATKKLQFLKMQEGGHAVRPQDFGLKKLSKRSLQRWAKRAREAQTRFGSSIYGLFERKRPGRPRSELPQAVLEEMEAVANEMYFVPKRPKLRYCWRALRARLEAKGLQCPTRTTFSRFIDRLKSLRDATAARMGSRRAYQLGRSRRGNNNNWLLAPDYAAKVAQLDGKLIDLQTWDDETEEPLGRPYLSLIWLPHYCAPMGWAVLFEPPSYRSATVAVRHVRERRLPLPSFLLVDNGSEFQNTRFDTLLATLGVSKVTRPPSTPRFSSEVESMFRRSDVELFHNLAGNTQASRDGREMTRETDPERNAIWPFSKLCKLIDDYLESLWDTPSPSLGTTPRKAFERDCRLLVSPAQVELSGEAAKVAFYSDAGTRVVQPGRGVFVFGYYYWSDAFDRPGVARSTVAVRFDPYDLYTIYCALGSRWIQCCALDAPELRNVTERERSIRSVAWRHLRSQTKKNREETYGRRLGEIAQQITAQEATLQARRRQIEADRKKEKKPRDQKLPTSQKPMKPKLPIMDFSHIV